MSDHESRVAQSRRLGQLLVKLGEQSKADFALIAAPLELPAPLARAILQLDQPAPMSELADQLGCDRSYVTALADQLEGRGLVTRAPGEDRRVKLLTLTQSGRQVRNELAAAIHQGSRVLLRLTDSERLILASLLQKLLPGQPDLPIQPS